MQIVINVPEKEFSIEIEDKFQDFFKRLKVETKDHLITNTSLLCGAYELETIEMFLDAFKNCTLLPKGHGDLKDELDLDLSSPSLGTDEYVGDLMAKHNIDYVNGDDEDKVRAFALDLIDSCMNVIETAPTIIEADAPKRRKGTPREDYKPLYDCEDWIP